MQNLIGIYQTIVEVCENHRKFHYGPVSQKSEVCCFMTKFHPKKHRVLDFSKILGGKFKFFECQVSRITIAKSVKN
jgi:hypothetical protein